MPKFSSHFESIQPSAIRMAQIEFSKRDDDVEAVNTAIGNVSLPLHPLLSQRMFNLDSKDSPFKEGVVRYTATRGMEETNSAFMNIIGASGCNTDGLYSQITTGGSQAMELVIVGVCGEAGVDESPLMLIDAAYTNYNSLASRLGRKTVSVTRALSRDGEFTLPSTEEIEAVITKEKPKAIVVIPYDNPTGQYYNREAMIKLAKIAVKHDMWIISDEAYRELYYIGNETSSVWSLSEEDVPGITGRRVSIESASKVWNGCGLRIGAIVTDNELFSERAVAENTAELCAPAIAQYIFGALANESSSNLNNWFGIQREYYKSINLELNSNLKKELPGLIVSSPAASIYSVVDVRDLVDDFDSSDFVRFCATHGSVDIDGKSYTLLVAPMAGFYSSKDGEMNPGTTQMRIAFVESVEKMRLVPILFAKLFKIYVER